MDSVSAGDDDDNFFDFFVVDVVGCDGGTVSAVVWLLDEDSFASGCENDDDGICEDCDCDVVDLAAFLFIPTI